MTRSWFLGPTAGLLVLALTAGNAFAATYYLAPTGDDTNDGSLASPFFTLARAWQEVGPGDTIYLRGGTYAYEGQQYLQARNGAPGQLIKVWAYPGEKPKLTMAPNYSGQDLVYFEGSYVHWKGLEFADFWPVQPIDYGWPAFRSGDSQHCIYEQLDYHHNRAGFSIRGGSTGNLILNSDFHHGADPANDYDGTDGLAIHFVDAGTENTVRGCRFFWNGDDGLDLWDNKGLVHVENSWAFYNGFIPDTFDNAGNGSGFKLGLVDPSAGLKRVVSRNLAYRNKSWGFVENDSPVEMHIYNNTSVHNGGRNFWFGDWGADYPLIARNNLAYGPAGTAPELGGLPVTFGPTSTLDHNSFGASDPWADLGLVSDADFVSMDASQLLAPRKPDGSLPDIDFLRLAPGSDLINAGVDVGLPYAGAAPDLGAFEDGVAPPAPDAGPTDGDAGPVDGDAGPVDGDGSPIEADAGAGGSGADTASGGCGCAVGGGQPGPGRFALALAALLAGLCLVGRRRGRR